MLPTSKAQDPTGAYIKTWVPELSALPAKFVHAPWEAPAQVLAAAGVVLGTTYPDRITGDIDMGAMKRVNTDAIAAARAAAPGRVDAAGYDLIMVPAGATTRHDGTAMRVFTKPEYRRAAGAQLVGGRRRGGGVAERPSKKKQQQLVKARTSVLDMMMLSVR